MKKVLALRIPCELCAPFVERPRWPLFRVQVAGEFAQYWESGIGWICAECKDGAVENALHGLRVTVGIDEAMAIVKNSNRGLRG